MKLRVYISGAITGSNDYMDKFAQAEKHLISLGYEVINPAAVCARLPELSHAEYMEICIVLLNCCNAIYLLKGWEQSKGARMELIHAHDKNYEIIEER